MDARLQRLFPILEWSPRYTRGEVVNDLFAAVIVTIVPVPQSLACAMLAGLLLVGLPPVMGSPPPLALTPSSDGTVPSPGRLTALLFGRRGSCLPGHG